VWLRPGEIVVARHLQRFEISAVYLNRVVAHDDTGLYLWAAEGTRQWLRFMPDGRMMRETPLSEWVPADKPMRPYAAPQSRLTWHPVGVDYSAQWFFAGGRFTNWYVNLEQAAVVWRDAALAGVDTVDWDLDVWIEPDRRWRWKDEEELRERLESPEFYWVDDPDRARRAGLAAIALAEAGAFPFDGSWCDFQPDPTWLPIVDDAPPPGWDRPSALSPRPS
jgi:hypothetical protein